MRERIDWLVLCGSEQDRQDMLEDVRGSYTV